MEPSPIPDSSYSEFIDDLCSFHCVCFQNEAKRASMQQRFETLGIALDIYGGVPHTDPRIRNVEGGRQISPGLQRLWSVTYGHLDMIQQFYDSPKSYGFFCEDDIVVRRDLPRHLPHIIQEFDAMNLELLLLGYMKTHKVEGWMAGYEVVRTYSGRAYHRYPPDQWGVHLYMLSKAGAKRILDTYAHGYADEYVNDPERPFSPDWTITKCPGLNRALVTPMFAVEDGRDSYEHYAHAGQYHFHMETFRFNYVPDLFI